MGRRKRCCTLCAADGDPMPGCIYCEALPRVMNAEEREKRRTRTLLCVWCGESFAPTQHNQMYCAKECYREALTAKYQQQRPIINCEGCGAPFVQTRSDKLYCSAACGTIAWRRAHPEQYRAQIERKNEKQREERGTKPRTFADCVVCGRVYMQTVAHQRICGDDECKREAKNEVSRRSKRRKKERAA